MKLFGRDIGSPQDFCGLGFIWGYDTRFEIFKSFCEKCETNTYDYRVIDGSHCFNNIRLCSYCDNIKEKTGYWFEKAPSGTKVDLFCNGVLESKDFTGDYFPPGNLVVDYSLHHCGSEMYQYGEIEKENGVIASLFECSECGVERQIKYFFES